MFTRKLQHYLHSKLWKMYPELYRVMDIVKLEAVHSQILKFINFQLFLWKSPIYGNKEERSTLMQIQIHGTQSRRQMQSKKEVCSHFRLQCEWTLNINTCNCTQQSFFFGHVWPGSVRRWEAVGARPPWTCTFKRMLHRTNSCVNVG